MLDIVPKGGGRTKLQLNEVQRRYCAARTARDVVLKPRQIGFTTLELARDVWTFLTRPGARVVVVCQSLTDHGPLKQLSMALRTMFAGLRRDGIAFDFATESMSEWELAGQGSSLRILEAGASEAAAEKKGRAGTITRLHLTETAFYEYASATLNALLECVPSVDFGTEIVIESTPNGAAGLFYEKYEAAKKKRGSYSAHFYPWFTQAEYRTALAPGETIEPESEREKELVRRYGVDDEQLKWYRQKVTDKGQPETDQEYPSDEETCWLTDGRQFFDVEQTTKLLSLSTEPIERRAVGRPGSGGELLIWSHARPQHRYALIVDPSEGVGGDPSVIVVYDRRTLEHVATLRGQFSTWETAGLAAALAGEYTNAEIIVERNNHGHAVLQALEREHEGALVYVHDDERPGWYSTHGSRSAALEALHAGHRSGEWSSPDRLSLAEMLRFIVGKDGKPKAMHGAHDDLVMAHAIAWDLLSVPMAPPARTGSTAGYRYAGNGRALY